MMKLFPILRDGKYQICFENDRLKKIDWLALFGTDLINYPNLDNNNEPHSLEMIFSFCNVPIKKIFYSSKMRIVKIMMILNSDSRSRSSKNFYLYILLIVFNRSFWMRKGNTYIQQKLKTVVYHHSNMLNCLTFFLHFLCLQYKFNRKMARLAGKQSVLCTKVQVLYYKILSQNGRSLTLFPLLSARFMNYEYFHDFWFLIRF